MTGETIKIVVIGASTGGLDALRLVLPGVPRDLPAALFVVIHMAAESPRVLPEILGRISPFPALHPNDWDSIQPRHIYVAPPNHHLLLERGRIRLSRGPKENRFRPAVDPLFRSAAAAYGPRVIGVVLSGGLDDGSAGLAAIKARRGLTVVQDPREAQNPSMPASALAQVAIDHVLPAAQIGPLLAELSPRAIDGEGEPMMPDHIEIETRIALEENAMEAGVMRLGTLTPYTCPECHGTLLEVTADGVLRFRCHTGHAFSVQSLLAEGGEVIEEAVWSAVRAVEERMLLLRHAAEHAREHGDHAQADALLRQAREAEQQVQLLRLAILRHEHQARSRPAETSSSSDLVASEDADAE
jgi:two-component system chemotaxis response regulator CheB